MVPGAWLQTSLHPQLAAFAENQRETDPLGPGPRNESGPDLATMFRALICSACGCAAGQVLTQRDQLREQFLGDIH